MMRSDFGLGRLWGLQFTATPLALLGTLLIWLAAGLAAYWMLDLTGLQTAAVGLAGALLWWLADIVHHFGHAYAARTTGYPMIGIELGQYAIFCRSVYPADEPALPAAVHIRRALSGPIVSFAVGIGAGLLALLLTAGSIGWWLAAYTAVVSFVVFGLGAFLPLGFTDGSTILTWWGKR